tara:strand:+ start:3507 stop:3776 length:270 start_codon:yes stop_codon:yes gene_type:complete
MSEKRTWGDLHEDVGEREWGDLPEGAFLDPIPQEQEETREAEKGAAWCEVALSNGMLTVTHIDGTVLVNREMLEGEWSALFALLRGASA